MRWDSLPKFDIVTKNEGLENVSPFTHGDFGHPAVKFQGCFSQHIYILSHQNSRIGDLPSFLTRYLEDFWRHGDKMGYFGSPPHQGCQWPPGWHYIFCLGNPNLNLQICYTLTFWGEIVESKLTLSLFISRLFMCEKKQSKVKIKRPGWNNLRSLGASSNGITRATGGNTNRIHYMTFNSWVFPKIVVPPNHPF